MKHLFVCESCGCIHTREDEIFAVGGLEMCTECAPVTRIPIPECGFGCAHCYDTCPLIAEAAELKLDF